MLGRKGSLEGKGLTAFYSVNRQIRSTCYSMISSHVSLQYMCSLYDKEGGNLSTAPSGKPHGSVAWLPPSSFVTSSEAVPESRVSLRRKEAGI